MAYTTIDDPTAYFKVKAYAGDGNDGHAITFDDTDTNMQPDFVWLKGRSFDDNHTLYDSVRGANKYFHSDTSAQEYDNSSPNFGVKSFDSDGFTLGAWSALNRSSENHIAWCWKESATSGFDIVTYTGTGSAHTISHSLSAKPDLLIVKYRGGTANGQVWHKSLPDTGDKVLYLSTNHAKQDEIMFNDTEPTSSVFSVGAASETNTSSGTYVAYLWAGKQGYSKFGSYEGNNNADGTYVHLGFRPSMVIIKNIDTADSWNIFDTKREPYNVMGEKWLGLNESTTEFDPSNVNLDFLANGFKLRHTDQKINSSETFIYMAWADAPFVNSKGVPCTAF